MYLVNSRQHGFGAAGDPGRRRRRAGRGRPRGCRRVMSSSPRAATACAKVHAVLLPARHAATPDDCRRPAPSARRARPSERPASTAGRQQPPSQCSTTRDESVTPIHPAAGRHHPADGGDSGRGHDRLSATAAVGAARGRLPDHPGADLLPGREPRGHHLGHHRAVGKAVRPDAWPRTRCPRRARPAPRSSRCSSTCPCHRCGRAGSAGGDQRRAEPAAAGSAGAADLCQGQSGRCAGADSGHHLRR